jgi:hypothetical protein
MEWVEGTQQQRHVAHSIPPDRILHARRAPLQQGKITASHSGRQLKYAPAARMPMPHCPPAIASFVLVPSAKRLQTFRQVPGFTVCCRECTKFCRGSFVGRWMYRGFSVVCVSRSRGDKVRRARHYQRSVLLLALRRILHARQADIPPTNLRDLRDAALGSTVTSRCRASPAAVRPVVRARFTASTGMFFPL